MIFNRLFCNRGILIQNFRQHGWIGVLFLITLLFSLPLYIATEYRDVPQQIISLFQANGEVQILFAITLPVAAGIFLFGTFNLVHLRICSIVCRYVVNIY